MSTCMASLPKVPDIPKYFNASVTSQTLKTAGFAFDLLVTWVMPFWILRRNTSELQNPRHNEEGRNGKSNWEMGREDNIEEEKKG